MATALGTPDAKIGLCGINPHAGEGGLFGNEDAEQLAPAVEAARQDGIPCQVHVTAGATPTDAQPMQINRAGMATGLLNVPLRYMHTPCEVLCLSDLESTARLLAACCRRITPDTDFTPR